MKVILFQPLNLQLSNGDRLVATEALKMLQGGSLGEWKLRMGKDGRNQASDHLGSEGIERLGVLFQNYTQILSREKEHNFHKDIDL
jgi:hypothetical protein